MYPASFEYFAPSTLDEALSVLERYGDEAKVLAGGQSLIPLMKLRFASPRALVDLNGIDALRHHLPSHVVADDENPMANVEPVDAITREERGAPVALWIGVRE